MSSSAPILTVTTDLGLRDDFIAAVKGVIWSVNPDVKIVDISNLVPPQDIFTAAFTLGKAWSYFPYGTVHLAIVESGVGGAACKGLAVDAAGHLFVCPDNGILTYVYEEHPGFEAYEITAEHYYRKPVSPDCHGRDIYAPIAAWVSKGVPLHQIGERLEDPFRLQLPAVQKVKDTLLQGLILAVDRFGNLITNLKPADVPRAYKILAGHREITTTHKTYQEGAPGEIFVVPGSTGYLEIAVKDGSAASLLKVRSGSPIGVVLT